MQSFPELHFEREELVVVRRGFHLGRDRDEGIANGLARAQRAQTHHVDSDGRAHLEDREQVAGDLFAAARVLGHHGEQIEPRVPLEVDDARAAPLRDLHEPDLLEALQGFADHVPVDPEDLRQGPLGGEPLAGAVATRHDFSSQLLEHLIGERMALNGSQRHARAGWTN